jgi:lysyl-tRNA synthetase, class II
LHGEGFLEFSTPVIRRHPGSELTPRIELKDGRFLRDSPAFGLRYNLRYSDRIFEIGPCFRREDVSATHLPEFTMLDLYWRGAAMVDAVNLARKLISKFYDKPIVDLSFAEHVMEEFSVDLASDELGEQVLEGELRRIYKDNKATYLELLDQYVKERIEPLSSNRCCIVWDFPLSAEARARRKEGAACIADRVEFQIEGMEVVHAYRDENDPSLLVSRAEELDDLEPEDRIMSELLASNIVPADTSGFGIGIERFCQACLKLTDIHDLITSKPFI